MPPRGLFGVALLVAVLVATPATAMSFSAAEFDSLPDATGDGDPDISRVVASSNSSGAITFVVALANRTELADGEYVQVWLDSDAQPQTGEQPNGVDYVLQMDRSNVDLFRWNNGSTFEGVDSQTVYGYVFNGFRMSVNRSEIGGAPSGAVNYWVETISGEKGDDAPDGRIEQHRLSTQPLRLLIAAFSATKRVKVGKSYVLAMRVSRSDLEEMTSAGEVRCVAKVGRATLKVQAVFPEDVAGCTGKAPKSAKGKTIRVTISLMLDGVTVSRTAPVKVR